MCIQGTKREYKFPCEEGQVEKQKSLFVYWRVWVDLKFMCIDIKKNTGNNESE